MSNNPARHLITLATLLALAGCSGGVTSEAQLTSAPPEPELDGAPQAVIAPPVVAPQTAVVVEAPAPRTSPHVVQAKDSNLWCDISVRRTSNGVRITPLVRSDRSTSGEYSLVITKSGAAGSSDISQGGPFDAPRGAKQELGSSEISLERGSTFRAVLKVRAGGHEVCRKIRS